MASVISRQEAYDGEPSKKVHRSDHYPVISDATRAEHERLKNLRDAEAEKKRYADILPDPRDTAGYLSESSINDLDHR